MEALQKRTESFWTLTWLPHGCSAKTDGLFVDVNMAATWMLCKNGRTLSGRYHGCHMDALQKRTESFWTLTWLLHGCSARTEEHFLDVIMVVTWMLSKNGRTLCGRSHGCHMDALQKRTNSFWTLSWLSHGCSAKTDGVFLDVIMVATWMLCKIGRSLCGR